MTCAYSIRCRPEREISPEGPAKAQMIAAKYYLGGVLVESGGGEAVPLLEESAGGVVAEGLLVAGEELESLGGGAAGADVAESELGELGEVDCCLEQATRASALRHITRKLRFINITSLCTFKLAGDRLGTGGTQRPVASGVPATVKNSFDPAEFPLTGGQA